MTSTIDELRKFHRDKRAGLCQERLRQNAENLCYRVLRLDVYRRAKTVAAYIAIRGEVDVAEIIQAGAALGQQFFLPVLREESMHFLPWAPGDALEKKQFGLLEPSVPLSRKVEVADLDAVLTPLVVFDDRCNRIGQGGGFYDRTFAHKLITPESRPSLIGVAHDTQRENHLPAKSWDVPLDHVVTDKNIYTRAVGGPLGN